MPLKKQVQAMERTSLNSRMWIFFHFDLTCCFHVAVLSTRQTFYHLLILAVGFH
jgi:hypothetical protein